MLWYCLYDTCGETDQNEMYILSACVSQKVTTHFYSISFTHPFYLLHIWCKRESNVVVAMKRKREERVTHSTAQYSHPKKHRGNCICLRLTHKYRHHPVHVPRPIYREKEAKKRNRMVYAETAGFLLTLISWHCLTIRLFDDFLGIILRQPNGSLRSVWCSWKIIERRSDGRVSGEFIQTDLPNSFWKLRKKYPINEHFLIAHRPIGAEIAADFYLNLFQSK